MLRALLDTNQLVSSLLSARGRQAQLIDSWRRRDFSLHIALRQLEEIADVLARPKITKKYRIEREARDAFIALLRHEAIVVPDAPSPGVCRDPDDDAILGCAAAAGLDYLVTGDADLLSIREHGGLTVITATEFLVLLTP